MILPFLYDPTIMSSKNSNQINVPQAREAGYMKFTIGNIKNASVYYLIQAE